VKAEFLVSVKDTKVLIRTSWIGHVDIDVSALLLCPNGKAISDDHYIFYNQVQAPDNSVTLSSAIGSGNANEDLGEELSFDFSKASSEIEKIKIFLSIYPSHPSATFGSCKASKARLEDSSGKALYALDLTDDFGLENFVEFGEFVALHGSWEFRPSGFCGMSKMKDVLVDHGVVVERSLN
jgi:tellurium resistance protein TerD